MERNYTKSLEHVSDQADEQSRANLDQQTEDIQQDVFAKQEDLYTSGTSEMPA